MAKNPKAPVDSDARPEEQGPEGALKDGVAPGGTAPAANDPVPAPRTYIVVSPLWVGGKKHLPGARVALSESEAASLAGVVEPVAGGSAANPSMGASAPDEDGADDKK